MNKQVKNFNKSIILSILFLLCSCIIIHPTERPSLIFLPESLPKGRVGETYYIEIQPTNAETPVYYYKISNNNLPKGLNFRWEDSLPKAILEGIPEEAGTFNVIISAMCLGTSINGQMGSKEYTLIIDE
jgi:hypothetical protein